MIYVIGSMRNTKIPLVAAELRKQGHEVFDDWYSSGPETDDFWQAYEKQRGRTFAEALAGAHAQDVFHFDKSNLDRCSGGVLVLPAGKSGHLELGYLIGSGKKGYILLDSEPDRFDIMYNFATRVFDNLTDLLNKAEW
jgi:hypothetical protein